MADRIEELSHERLQPASNPNRALRLARRLDFASILVIVTMLGIGLSRLGELWDFTALKLKLLGGFLLVPIHLFLIWTTVIVIWGLLRLMIYGSYHAIQWMRR